MLCCFQSWRRRHLRRQQLVKDCGSVHLWESSFGMQPFLKRRGGSNTNKSYENVSSNHITPFKSINCQTQRGIISPGISTPLLRYWTARLKSSRIIYIYIYTYIRRNNEGSESISQTDCVFHWLKSRLFKATTTYLFGQKFCF